MLRIKFEVVFDSPVPRRDRAKLLRAKKQFDRVRDACLAGGDGDGVDVDQHHLRDLVDAIETMGNVCARALAVRGK